MLKQSPTILPIACLLVLFAGPAQSGPDRPLLSDKTLVVPKGDVGATTPVFVTNQNEPAKNRTTATVRWDDKALTIIFDCADRTIAARVTKRDGAVFYEDSVWVIVDTGHTHDRECEWVQFLTNPLGTIYDRKRFNKYGFNVAGLVIESAKTAQGWRAELTIPWEAFGSRPEVGDVWAMGLNRIDYPKSGREFLCWSPNYGVKDNGFLSVDRWGHVVYADERGNPGEGLKKLEQQHAKVLESVRRKAEYVETVVRGGGFAPWQSREKASAEEREFRAAIERRKDEMLPARVAVEEPALFSRRAVRRARRNLAALPQAAQWFEEAREVADYVVGQPDDYVEKMIPELTPGNPCARTCPHCTGRLSRGTTRFAWDYHEPEVIKCRSCEHAYPSPKYPETGKLVCPRTGQSFTYYLNEEERKHPEDRSGKYAYRFAARPVHISFSGMIRYYRTSFMLGAARKLALAHAITEEPRYARRAVQILIRMASCYRNWLYHDYWDTVADCDPIYAAFHDMSLRLEWKRNLSSSAFEDDTTKCARMLKDYWGAGRHNTCTDMSGGRLDSLCKAYWLVRDAVGADGRPLWDDRTRALVERDLFLEAVMTGEKWLGGPGQAKEVSNLAIRVYGSMATVARYLGIAEWADTAIRGYERARSRQIRPDGLSGESPSYTNLYLDGLGGIAETLDGFRWPKGMEGRRGRANLYQSDPGLSVMLRSALDSLAPNGQLLPLADTHLGGRLPRAIPGIGLRRLPRHFSGTFPTLSHNGRLTEADVFLCEAKDLTRRSVGSQIVATSVPLVGSQAGRLRLRCRPPPKELSEICFPNWNVAILRNGGGPDAAALALTFNGPGIHRHRDNLGICYIDRGNTILGDLGYDGDHNWMCSSFSHNLVTVDDEEQMATRQRVPAFRMMATSPKLSVVEASSRVYPQCRDYRRLVALLKGPNGRTFAVDIFRVKGGKRHDYRLFSEIASSDDGDAGALTTVGFNLPPEKPLPQVAGSVKREDTFGLRDLRTFENPPGSWQAVWKNASRSYRLWMLTKTHLVRASNGPGQERADNPGRRVRYLDAIRGGPDLRSVFVAIHEPNAPRGVHTVLDAERLQVPESAGPDAVALRIRTVWGTYRLFSEFADEVEIDGVRFQGTFGVICDSLDGGPWHFVLGASTLRVDGRGFSGMPARWSGKATGNTETVIHTSTPRPEGWPELPRGCTNYVVVSDGQHETGYPVGSARPRQITVRRFPLQKVAKFHLHALRYDPRVRRK